MFYIRNFKNFSQAKLDLDRPVTLLIGPNGSGKSNLIEAVELLSFLVEGHRLHEVTDIGRGGAIEVRGGLEACAKSGQDQFTLGVGYDLDVAGEVQPMKVEYEITIRVRPDLRIVGEHLKVSGRRIPVFEILSPDVESSSADNQVKYDNNDRGGSKPIESIAGDKSALSQYARFALRNKELPQTLGLIDALLKRLAAPSVIDPIPKLMRGYERRSETQLVRNGYNISPVLFNLWADHAVLLKDSGGKITRKLRNRRDVLQRILKRIAQLPDEAFTSFEFIRMPKVGDVLFAFKSSTSASLIDARLVSDGTLRALAILAALEISRPYSYLVLEELDNGVHPSRVPVLAEALFDCAARNKLHVFATTHNPATMNALSRDQLDSVLLVVSKPGVDGANLIRLEELPGYVEFIERGRLGDLVTRRVYEQHLLTDYEGNRRDDINSWIDALPSA